jgi:hypothetical protein
MITFVRRVRMLDGYFVEAMDLLKARVEYIEKTHGIKVEMHSRFGGPVGEIAMISQHEGATDLELFREKISTDVRSAKLLKQIAEVTVPGVTCDEIWMSL